MHYKNSPIVEALIDIKTESSLKFEDLPGIASYLATDYPQTKTRFVGEGKFSFGAETKATAEQKAMALMYFSADNKHIFQARVDGITLSRLAPYDTWNSLRDEAKRLWEIYREFAKPTKITRLAVRYINQIVFPSGRIEPEDYLRTYPELSRALPDELRNVGPFWMRLQIAQADIGAMLVINEALGVQTNPDSIPIVLDLDLYAEDSGIDERELWTRLEKFHERKNLYFEACITDKTRELIL